MSETGTDHAASEHPVGAPRHLAIGQPNWFVVAMVGLVLMMIVGSALALSLRQQTVEAAGPSGTVGSDNTRRCNVRNEHQLVDPDSRNIRITGPEEAIDYPGFVRGRFDSLAGDDILWVVTYAYDAERYWPAEAAVRLDRESGTWTTEPGSYFLGEPAQSGVAFDVLLARVDRGGEAFHVLTSLFTGPSAFNGWTAAELPKGLEFHDCARITRL